MINDPAIQHPPYLTFGALRVHVQRHLPAARHGPQHRPGRDAAQAQRPLGDVGVAGEGRRHRVVQGPGRALLGRRRSGRCPTGSPAASTSRRLAPWRAGSGVAARLPARPRRCPAATAPPHWRRKSPDWVPSDDRPTRLSSICRSRRPTRHRGNRNWCRSSRPAAAPDCPIHRTGGRGGRRFPGCPDNPGGSGAHHTGLHPGLLRPQPGTPRQAAARQRAGRRPPALPMWCRLRPKSSSGCSGAGRQAQAHPARQHNRGETDRPDTVQQVHGRHIQGPLQRLRHADRPREGGLKLPGA